MNTSNRFDDSAEATAWTPSATTSTSATRLLPVCYPSATRLLPCLLPVCYGPCLLPRHKLRARRRHFGRGRQTGRVVLIRIRPGHQLAELLHQGRRGAIVSRRTATRGAACVARLTGFRLALLSRTAFGNCGPRAHKLRILKESPQGGCVARRVGLLLTPSRPIQCRLALVRGARDVGPARSSSCAH